MQRIHRRGPHPVRGRSTRRRVDSSVSAACTSSPQPRCSPAFTCLPLLLAPIRGRTRSTLGRPFKRIDNSFPTQARLQRLPHRLQTEREDNSVATSMRAYMEIFPSFLRQTIARCARSSVRARFRGNVYWKKKEKERLINLTLAIFDEYPNVFFLSIPDGWMELSREMFAR